MILVKDWPEWKAERINKMMMILKTLGGGLLRAVGYKYLLKGLYRFLIRKELVKLTKKLDPKNKTALDEEIIDKIDEVFENL